MRVSRGASPGFSAAGCHWPASARAHWHPLGPAMISMPAATSAASQAAAHAPQWTAVERSRGEGLHSPHPRAGTAAAARGDGDATSRQVYAEQDELDCRVDEGGWIVVRCETSGTDGDIDRQKQSSVASAAAATGVAADLPLPVGDVGLSAAAAPADAAGLGVASGEPWTLSSSRGAARQSQGRAGSAAPTAAELFKAALPSNFEINGATLAMPHAPTPSSTPAPPQRVGALQCTTFCEAAPVVSGGGVLLHYALKNSSTVRVRLGVLQVPRWAKKQKQKNTSALAMAAALSALSANTCAAAAAPPPPRAGEGRGGAQLALLETRCRGRGCHVPRATDRKQQLKQQ